MHSRTGQLNMLYGAIHDSESESDVEASSSDGSCSSDESDAEWAGYESDSDTSSLSEGPGARVRGLESFNFDERAKAWAAEYKASRTRPLRAQSGKGGGGGGKGGGSKRRFEVTVADVEDELTEDFVKGSGRGGQKINKVRSRVVLTHVPTGIQVSSQKTRSLTSNRQAARTLLRLRLDALVNGEQAVVARRNVRKARRKRKAASRARKKYDGGSGASANVPSGASESA